MLVKIPSSFGVPGISGPPNWFTAPPTGSFRLDDVRWNGATSRTFAGGASQNPSLRATHSAVGGQHLYLSLRAPFVQELSDNNDFVFVGFQKTGSMEAMVISIRVHLGFTHTGPPPDANPPGKVVEVKVKTLQGGVWTDVATPAWVDKDNANTGARAWVQSSTEFPMTDPNNRWGVQLKVPLTAASPINHDSGPNLGTDFRMWYFIYGSSGGSPTLMADSGIPGNPTNQINLLSGIYPLPGTWDQYQLTSGPANDGGVAITWGDVLVNNIYGDGYKIANGQLNNFIARPRNYTPAQIPINGINATFRLANWGSVGMDPTQVDFTTGVWDYVDGQDENNPVTNDLIPVPSLPAGNNPPATNPILHDKIINLGAGKSLHQCMLVTLSGNNLIFLNNSIYQNMNFDQTSLLEREAELSIVGLKAFSPQPRDLYVAIEKINMPRNAPGTNEGRFLEGSMERLIKKGGPLAEKLKAAQGSLADGGDFGSSERLDALLKGLREALAEMKYRDIESGLSALDAVIVSLNRWLTEVKKSDTASKVLATVFDALADWLAASPQQASAKLDAFISQLRQWLLGVGDDPASLQVLPGVLRNFAAWLSTLDDDGRLRGPISSLFEWLHGNRPADQLTSILSALRESLGSLSTKNGAFRASIASFLSGVANWLRGNERLDVLVKVLSDAGLTTDELDELFPTVRLHCYHDTGGKFTTPSGTVVPLLQTQSSFGIYAYHEGSLEGWQTSIQGAQRIADNLYLIAVPNDGAVKVKVRVQAVEKGDERIPEDPIRPIEHITPEHPGCLSLIHKLLGLHKK
jgi:hypothetical protein